MKNKLWIAGFAALSMASCKAPLAVSSVQTQKNISIGTSLPEDAAMNAVISPYKKSLESQMNAKISHTNFNLNKQGDNSNLGNLLADFTYDGALEWAKSNNIPSIDAAVINIGGIRSTIGKGDILLKHIFEVMPFENELVIVKMQGSDLNSLFNYYAETQKNNPVSRLLVETDNGKITNALINGKLLDPAKTYYIATSDYLALGGDNMKFFSKGQLITTGIKLRDLYIEKFRQMPEVKTPTDVRLIFKGKTNRE